MNGFPFDLKAQGDFSFDACLAYLSRSDLQCLYEVEEKRIIRPLRLGADREPALLAIHSPEHGLLRIEALQEIEAPTGDMADEAASFVREWFDLNRDLTPFYELSERDPLLAEPAHRFRGLRLIGVPDLFEALCWAVLGQQITLSFAYTLKRRVTDAYGDKLEWNGRTYRLFPEPERLRHASDEELAALKLSRAKADTLRRIAAMTADGELSRPVLLAEGHEAAVQRLLRIRGVGPWTAQYVAMRCLRDPRALPLGDAGLQQAVRIRLGMDRKPTPKELAALFAGWAGWEAYAVFYLWRTLY